MNRCTKDTMKDLAIGGGIGLLFGAVCGSASGYAGLRQLCSIYGLDRSASCEFLVTTASNRAVQVGCSVGAAVGCATLSFAYTAYKAASRACNRQDDVRAIEITSSTNQNAGWA